MAQSALGLTHFVGLFASLVSEGASLKTQVGTNCRGAFQVVSISQKHIAILSAAMIIGGVLYNSFFAEASYGRLVATVGVICGIAALSVSGRRLVSVSSSLPKREYGIYLLLFLNLLVLITSFFVMNTNYGGKSLGLIAVTAFSISGLGMMALWYVLRYGSRG